MPNEWFIRNANQVKGPLSDQQVKQLAALGQITPATHIRLGAGAWTTASSVRGLFPPPPTPDPAVDDFGFDALIENASRDEESGSRSGQVTAVSETATKTCPFCSEEIKATAVKCKHCGEFLGDRPVSQPNHRNAVSNAARRPPMAPTGPERTLWEAKPDYRSYLPAWLFGGLIGFQGAIIFLAAVSQTDSQQKDTLMLLALSLLAAGMCCVVFAFLNRNSITYRRTTQRIVCEWGIFSRHSSEVRLSDITAMNLKQFGFDSLFGTGTIELCTSGTSGIEVRLRAVPDAKQVREEIRQARDAYGATT
jgi:hypothetical protein